MKQYATIAGLFLIVSGLFLASCRKDKAGNAPGIQLSLDSLATLNTAVLPGAIYTDAAFTSETTGYAISNDGLIVKTTDGGQNWLTLPSPASFFLKAIQFTDAQMGYIIGGDETGSYLLKTTNGGNNWTMINLPVAEGGSPTGLYFTNNHKGFITGPKFFLTSTDGGSTWIPVLPGNNDDFYDVQFNGNTGIATSTIGVYYRTTDAGNHWQRHETVATNQLREIFFAGAETYIKSGTKLINTNPAKPTITIPSAVQQLQFIDAQACIGIGQHYETGFWPYGDIFITNNNWATSSAKKFMPDEALNFSAVAKLSDRKVIMLGTGHLKVAVVTLKY